jgi:hypothetical protein
MKAIRTTRDALIDGWHHMVLLDKVGDSDARSWHALAAVEHKVLEAQIASDLRGRHGAATLGRAAAQASALQ